MIYKNVALHVFCRNYAKFEWKHDEVSDRCDVLYYGRFQVHVHMLVNDFYDLNLLHFKQTNQPTFFYSYTQGVESELLCQWIRIQGFSFQILFFHTCFLNWSQFFCLSQVFSWLFSMHKIDIFIIVLDDDSHI